MFEGNINRLNLVEPRESGVLRQFRWTDLVARLAATRDLREEIIRNGEGDFHAFPTIRRSIPDEGKPAVNHTGLSDGKSAVVSLGEAAHDDAVQGDREKP